MAVTALAVVAMVFPGCGGIEESAPSPGATSSARSVESSPAVAQEYVNEEWGIRFEVSGEFPDRLGPYEIRPGQEALIFANPELVEGWSGGVMVIRRRGAGDMSLRALFKQLEDPEGDMRTTLAEGFGGGDVEVYRPPSMTRVGPGWKAVSASFTITIPETTAQGDVEYQHAEFVWFLRGDAVFQIATFVWPAGIFEEHRRALELTVDTLAESR